MTIGVRIQKGVSSSDLIYIHQIGLSQDVSLKKFTDVSQICILHEHLFSLLDGAFRHSTIVHLARFLTDPELIISMSQTASARIFALANTQVFTFWRARSIWCDETFKHEVFNSFWNDILSISLKNTTPFLEYQLACDQLRIICYSILASSTVDERQIIKLAGHMFTLLRNYQRALECCRLDNPLTQLGPKRYSIVCLVTSSYDTYSSLTSGVLQNKLFQYSFSN